MNSDNEFDKPTRERAKPRKDSEQEYRKPIKSIKPKAAYKHAASQLDFELDGDEDALVD